jgi:NOL1/NOP2/sun family putative RNA methylase
MEKLIDKLPKEFKERMKNELGGDYEKYEKALESSSVRGIRVNTKKISAKKFAETFQENIKQLPFSTDGFLLDSDEKLGNSPAHLSGLFYMQEPSSMLSVCSSGIDKEKRDLKVLDLCASPGGKSGQIACRISENSILVSNEIIRSRAEVLYSNIERQGFKNVVITNEDPENLLCFEGYFDYVFVDAPCSGEGMFRKNPETISEWSEENVKICAERQKKILDVAQKLVASGGKLVYSTCTFSKQEDEEIVSYFLKNYDYELCSVPDEVKKVTLPVEINGVENQNARKFFPYVSDGEGQFVAVFKCTDDERFDKLHTKKHFNSIERSGRAHLKPFEVWQDENLTQKVGGTIFEVGNNLFLAPKLFDSNMQTALDGLKFLSIGVKLGTIVQDRFEPNHAIFMAMEDLFKTKIELNEEQLKKYLHGEELSSNETRKGYGVVASGGHAIGGVRIIQGKLKNLYPKGLRI